MIFISAADICTGAVVPLPFLPDGLRNVLEILPFVSVQNVLLRAYSGNLSGNEVLCAACLQIFWVVVLIFLGKQMERKGLQRLTVAGG